MTEVEYNNIVLTKQLIREILISKKPMDKRVRCIDWLIKLGADKNARIYGKSLLTHAIERKEEDIVKILRKKGSKEWIISEKEAEKLGKKLFSEVEKGDFEKVKELIEEGADVNVCNEDKWSSLLVASSKGFCSIVEMLIERGADVNRKNGDKMSSLLGACLSGHLDVARVLIKNNAKIEDVTENGETTLMFAVEKGNYQIVKFLVEEGGDVNKKDCYGKTALMRAVVKEKSGEIVRYLLEHGVDVDEQNDDGLTALMLACGVGNVEAVELLVDYGARVGIKDNEGNDVLDRMKFFYSDDKVKIWKILEKAKEIEEFGENKKIIEVDFCKNEKAKDEKVEKEMVKRRVIEGNFSKKEEDDNIQQKTAFYSFLNARKLAR